MAHPQVLPRYRSTYFLHIFTNDYSAGYYSYVWSEVLDADSVEWLRENSGLGREPRLEPLLARRSLEV